MADGGVSKTVCENANVEDPRECIEKLAEKYPLPYYFDGSFEDFNWKFEKQPECWLKYSDRYHL